jgi:hypothetical protein
MFALTVITDEFFFTPRLEEDFYESKLLFDAREYDKGIVYVFPINTMFKKAEEIYAKLKQEFKYDIEIARLEKILDNEVFDNYCRYSTELDEMLSKEVFEEFKKDKRLKSLANGKKLFILDFDDISYKDFMDNYSTLHRKMEYKIFDVKQRIIQREDYKIKKLNILGKILKDYCITI